MGLFSSKNKDGSIGTNLAFVDGMNTFFKGEAVELSLYEDYNEIRIRSRIDKNKPLIHLKLDKITKAECISEKEIIEKSKSVGGRAIVGGVLLGPVGAIVGGMSGIGNKNKSKYMNFIVINYTSNGEEKALSFEIVGSSLGWDKVLKEIKGHTDPSDGIGISKTDIEL